MAPPTLIVRSPQRFRAAMYGAGFDRQRLSAAVGVTKQFVSLIARGRRRCRPTIAARIAQELHTPVAALFTIAPVSEESDNNIMEIPVSPNAVTLDDPFLRFKEVVELLPISEPTLRALRFRGEGPPFIPVGRLLVIRKSEALRWFKETYEDAAKDSAAK